MLTDTAIALFVIALTVIVIAIISRFMPDRPLFGRRNTIRSDDPVKKIEATQRHEWYRNRR